MAPEIYASGVQENYSPSQGGATPRLVPRDERRRLLSLQGRVLPQQLAAFGRVIHKAVVTALLPAPLPGARG